jgi:Peptidase A4 family
MKSLSSAVTAVVLLAAPLAGIAQNNATRLQPNEHTLNLPGATTIDAPPAGFDPISASDEELAYYGFPPRPNEATEPKAYATWARAMKASQIRVVPQLEQTSILHGPVKKGKLANPTAVESIPVLKGQPTNTDYSYNWSGYVDFSGARSFGSSSYYFTVADFVVPVAQQAGCDNKWDWGSAWTGIDGDGSDDVLQAGIEFDAFCSLGGLFKSSYYSTWYEWAPYNEVRVPSVSISPGDDIFVEVWDTSSTSGHAYLVNENTHNYFYVSFGPPSGYSLVGNSAEWIVERPLVNGSLATLTDYTMDPFWDSYGYTRSYAFNDLDEATPIDMLTNSSTLYSYPEYVGLEGFVAHYY